ncbi:MAG: ISL3 family transposase [bacterium]
MMIKKLFETALSIHEPWYVKGLTFDEEKKQLNIHIDFKRGSRFYYTDDNSGQEGYYTIHDTIEKQWRHLNFFEHECYLYCRTPRIKLPDGKVRLISPPWSGVNSGFTLLFEALMLELCTHMPVATVGRIIHESDDKLWRILERYIQDVREQEDYSDVSKLGVDETSRAKGHEYISLFVDLLKKRTLFIADGKDSHTVETFARDFESHKGKREQISDVSCDMSPAFIKGVKDSFPSAEITFDKFHILKIINEAVDKVRREEVQLHSILIGKRYIFLKNNDNLTKNQKEQLSDIKLSRLNLKTVRALHIREAFQSIYQSGTVVEFEILLKKWFWWATHSRIKPMRAVAHTIKRHWQGVINWKMSQITNGLLEGLNSLIQAAKSKARGYSSSKNFKIIAYLVTGKLDFGKINPAYGTFK